MVRIFCKNNNKSKSFEAGVNLIDVCKRMNLELPYKPVAARVNNEVVGLTYRVYRNKDIEFLDITSEDGMRMYVRSLTFVMMKAMHELFPGRTVRFENPISKGYYCRMETELTESEVDKVREAMHKIIERDIHFHRIECHTAEAMKIFSKIGRGDKVRQLETYGSLYASYYMLEDYIDYYYGGLLPSTGYLTLFEIEKFCDGVLLRVPDRDKPMSLEDKVPQEKLQERFTERLRWQQIMGVETVGDFNKAITEGHGIELVNVSEALQEKRIAFIADEIKRRGSRVVLIAGPSSSGKTTTGKRLSVHLMACGLRPYAISLDDFFLNRTQTPLKEDGDYDFESIYSIDLPYFNESLSKILAGEEIPLPHYNFQRGEREYLGNTIKLTPQMVLVIEGTHGLNPMLTAQIPEEEKFRIYVSALTSIKLDFHNYIPTSDNRLLRRMLRDYKYRGYDAVETIRRWPDVREGEEKWIFPYQENADVMFNSALLYELAVLKPHVEPLLRQVPENREEYSVARRLLKFLEYIVPLPDKELPPTSLIREFLGGSSFTY
ncbi:MAG: nucleoside kinase [Bacteroidaceae bacterium]|nr:nucleoside kinase [Bacteroidaceae bacterium]